MDNSRGAAPILPSLRAMTGRWQVPGHDVLELVGFGRTGELWRGRDRATGAPVALRRLVDPDPAVLDAVRRDATVVRSLPSPHLVRLRSVVADALVLDLADGGSLVDLLARRGRLAPGEVVTAVAPLAQAVAEAHAHGLVHGHLGLSSVLLDGDGRPLLDDLGRTTLRAPAEALDPTGALGGSADVWALGALAHQLLTGTAYEQGTALPAGVPAGLRRAVAAALDPDPAARPAADTLAASLLAACPPLPLGGLRVQPGRSQTLASPTVASPTPAPPTIAPPTQTGRGRAVAAGALALALVTGVVLAGVLWGRGAVERAADVPAAQGAGPVAGSSAGLEAGSAAGPALAPGPDWTALLDRLDAARSRAFATGDGRSLAAVYTPGSPALAADSDLLRQLALQGRRVSGLRHRVGSVRPSQLDETSVRLEVVEVLSGYDLLDRAGRAVQHQREGSPVRRQLVLRLSPAGWRVAEVRR